MQGSPSDRVGGCRSRRRHRGPAGRSESAPRPPLARLMSCFAAGTRKRATMAHQSASRGRLEALAIAETTQTITIRLQQHLAFKRKLAPEGRFRGTAYKYNSMVCQVYPLYSSVSRCRLTTGLLSYGANYVLVCVWQFLKLVLVVPPNPPWAKSLCISATRAGSAPNEKTERLVINSSQESLALRLWFYSLKTEQGSVLL